MPVQLNHTIVASRDNKQGAQWMAEMLGLPDPAPFGPFMGVETENGVALDFLTHTGEITPQHYAFLITEEEFDQIFGRIQERELRYWADPHRNHLQQIKHNDGGRGVYFEHPDGHLLEIITRPYGSGG